jgi:molybdopterin/thiamine biosynthesis adenylyltransferase
VSIFYHEALQRGAELLERARGVAITVCGAGALGANVAETLGRSGIGALRVVDHDRVEERNLSTQPYSRADVGAAKARVLANCLYRAVGAEVDARVETLTAANVGKLLGGSAVVVDAFDNSVARAAVTAWCAHAGVACLHAGVAGGYGEVIWNESYRVPSDAGDDVCDYPLARTLAVLTAAIACEEVVSFLATGERRSFTVTLGDLAVRPL